MSNTDGDRLRVAMAAWEIGRIKSGLGAKIGGLGVIVEELPPELMKAADRQGLTLEIETLSPCFAHYDKSKLTALDLRLPVTIEGYTFEFQAFEHVFTETVFFADKPRSVSFRMIYFWDRGQLHWTHANAIYPNDPWMGAKLYSSLSQAMAGYIRQSSFQTVHLHDYHVGLVPFYLGDEYIESVPVHFTIHNASYQGIIPLGGRGGYGSLDQLNLPGERLFHKYFDFFDHLNFMKACMLKVHETGGKITTVSGDINATWGYAAELKENSATIYQKAYRQKGSPPGEVFVPNNHLNLFELLPIAGITNGMSDSNRPENLPELNAAKLRELQSARGPHNPIFTNPVTQSEMLAHDHNFGADDLETKSELHRLLHLETFGREPQGAPLLITAVGRLVEQKNFGVVADIIERTISYDAEVKFIILASPPAGDLGGQALAARFTALARVYPERVYYSREFNFPLSKLILAGGDFTLIPSRFEPCGLVDYEASLLGTIVIGRLTGGLAKVRHCGYLYEWLDMSDRAGEAHAFFQKIREAIDTYRRDPARHRELILRAMRIDASWDASAAKYIDMYRYGLLFRRWIEKRRESITRFVESLGPDYHLFKEFFHPGLNEYSDRFNWELKNALSHMAVNPPVPAREE